MFFGEFILFDYFLFLIFNILMTYMQLIVSVIMGKKLFLIANIFGGIQLNGFLFGLCLNLSLLCIKFLGIKITFHQFLILIIIINFALFTSMLFYYFKNHQPLSKKNNISKLVQNGSYVFIKQLSGIASFNLDIIFVRLLLGESIIFVYTTFSTFARMILLPKNIFSPIIVPFITESLLKRSLMVLNF